MSQLLQTIPPFTGPIARDWTIEALLEWFAADDDRLSDPALRAPLRAIEESLTGTRWTRDPGASPFGARPTREPAIVALVRSVALHVSRHPALRARTVAEALCGGAGRAAVPVAETVVLTRS